MLGAGGAKITNGVKSQQDIKICDLRQALVYFGVCTSCHVTLSFRYGNALDYSRPKVKEGVPLNLNKAAAYEEPSRTASAKQHYLKQSRYLPGNIFSKRLNRNIYHFYRLAYNQLIY